MEVDGRKTEEDDNIEKDSFCEPCKREDLKVSANGLCNECEEYMCSVCFGHHLKAKSCSGHVLIKESQCTDQRSTVNVEICAQHENEKVKFFCRKHSEVGCGDCMVLDHNSCKPEYINNLSENLKKEEAFKDMTKKMNRLDKEATAALPLLQEYRQENEKMLDKAVEEIKAFRKRIDEYLDKAEADLISDIKAMHAENEKKIKEGEELMKSINEAVKKIQHELSEELHSATILFINYVRVKPKLDDVEKSLNEAAVDSSLTEYEFRSDENFKEIVSCGKQFGYLQKIGMKWKKSDLKPSMFSPGVRVRRGPDWDKGDMDGNSLGTVTNVYGDYSLIVKWDHGITNHPCRGGTGGIFDIEPVCVKQYIYTGQ